MYSAHFIYGYIASDMVNDHSDSSKGSVCMHHPTDRIAHTAFVILVVELWLEQEIAQWVDPSHHEQTTPLQSYISLPPLR